MRPDLSGATSHLEEAFERVEEGAVYAIVGKRDTNANLPTRMLKIIKRAGLTPCPRVFHNLRASRQTELAASFPFHMVRRWLGNTVAVADDHYLTVRKEDFEKASRSGAKSGAATRRNVSHVYARIDGELCRLRDYAGRCDGLRLYAKLPSTPQGDSNPLPVSRKGNASKEVAASPDCPLAHSLAREIEKHPDLQRVLDAWPSLPDALKAGILAMIDAARKDR